MIAVFGKTEGNGLVNDYARGYAAFALNLMFQRHLPAEAAAKICLVMSGGTEGGMSPHWTVFERSEEAGGKGPALAFGRAHTRCLARGASRPAGAGRYGRGRGEGGDGRCRHRRRGRYSFRPGQMPAADGAARQRSRSPRRRCCDQGHSEVDGAVARGERPGRCGRARRGRARGPDGRADRQPTGTSGRAARAARRASSFWGTRWWCSECRPAGADRLRSIMR